MRRSHPSCLPLRQTLTGNRRTADTRPIGPAECFVLVHPRHVPRPTMQITHELTPDRISERRVLAVEDCRELLSRVGWGVLSVVNLTGDARRAYGVPVTYAFTAGRLYLASGPGAKRDALETTGSVCLTVIDVE